MGGDDQDYVGTCIDIPIESKVFGNDERVHKLFNWNANDPNQPVMVSYKRTTNPYQSIPSHFKALPNKNNSSNESSTRRYNQCKMDQSDACDQSWNAFSDRWALIIYAYLFLALVLASGIVLIMTHSPPYLIENVGDYQVPMMTKEYGIEFYVVSSDKFDEKYPVGTQDRTDIENRIIKDYLQFATKYCKYERGRNSKRPDIPTLVCDKLQRLGIKKT
ncbi:hypothetical protein CTI12_AA583890 [Artemisia annua]|uniref:Uncharacterized protein n=1 Tax=Artemisia annua TaxID=35608 RepID=A0A2U1KMI3_ARTAN|nr:hypothetical protein CTI12_AA583890 [Artemisia annua]